MITTSFWELSICRFFLVVARKSLQDGVRSVVITAEAVIVTALLAMMPSAKTFMGTAFLTVALPAGT